MLKKAFLILACATVVAGAVFAFGCCDKNSSKQIACPGCKGHGKLIACPGCKDLNFLIACGDCKAILCCSCHGKGKPKTVLPTKPPVDLANCCPLEGKGKTLACGCFGGDETELAVA